MASTTTPFAQVRIPLTGPLLFYPLPLNPFMLTLYYWAKNYPAAGEYLSRGMKIMQRQNNYPAAE